MSTPVPIYLNAHYRGDKWEGIPVIGPVEINGSPPSGTLARIRMHFTHPDGSVFRLDSDSSANPDAPITIDDAATWGAHIPEVQSFLMVPGRWDWDMEFYQTGDTGPLTLYRGQLTVNSDITR